MPFSARGGAAGGFPILNSTSIAFQMGPPPPGDAAAAGGDPAADADNAPNDGSNGGAQGDRVTVQIPGGAITGHFAAGSAPNQEEFARMIQFLAGGLMPGAGGPPQHQQNQQQQQQVPNPYAVGGKFSCSCG